MLTSSVTTCREIGIYVGRSDFDPRFRHFFSQTQGESSSHVAVQVEYPFLSWTVKFRVPIPLEKNKLDRCASSWERCGMETPSRNIDMKRLVFTLLLTSLLLPNTTIASLSPEHCKTEI